MFVLIDQINIKQLAPEIVHIHPIIFFTIYMVLYNLVFRVFTSNNFGDHIDGWYYIVFSWVLSLFPFHPLIKNVNWAKFLTLLSSYWRQASLLLEIKVMINSITSVEARIS